MSEYKPGTVAVATVRGVKNVRVMLDVDGEWLTATIVGGYQFHRDENVTDIRPQVLLDLDDYSGERAVNYLRNLARESRDVMGNTPSPRGKLALLIADQIEAQVRPKTPEPKGLGAVVEGREGNRWVRTNESVELPWRKIGPVDRVSKWEAITSSYEPVSVLSLGVDE